MLLRRHDGFEIDTTTERIDVDRVYHWLSTDAYWAVGRSAQTVATSIANSLCYGVYSAGGQQVGFARAVTDDATFAWICDVYVDRSARGQGLGTWLAQSIVDHLQGRGLARFLLATADAHEVYRKVGFAELIRPSRWMEIDHRILPEPGELPDNKDH